METFFREDRDITMLQLTYDSSTCERLQNEMGFHVTNKVTDFYRDGVENRFFKYVCKNTDKTESNSGSERCFKDAQIPGSGSDFWFRYVDEFQLAGAHRALTTLCGSW